MEGATRPEDRYRRLSLLGEGGSAQVWLVEDTLHPGRRVALKQPVDTGASHAASIRREFVTLARLRHPSLVEAFDFEHDPEDGSPRFTLEHVAGESFVSAARRDASETLLPLTAEALRVLAFLHDFGLVHRDLTPGNVLVRSRPRLGCRLVLLDLGLALADVEGEREATVPVAGTLPYVAPELFDGGTPSARSDLYSLAALVHEAIHDRPPVALTADGDLAAFVDRVRSGRRARPPLPTGYPPNLGGWIDELLSPDPAARPASATEALARLNTACGTTFPAETAVGRAARLASDPPAGRDAERRELLSLLRPDAERRVVWIEGAAGVGKSRLLRWLRTEAIQQGWRVFAPPPSRLLEPPSTLLESLRSSARQGPTLLTLDDLETADAGVVSLLDRIARQSDEPPVQVVAGVRPAEVAMPRLARLLADTMTVPSLRRIELKALNAEGLRALAERAAGQSQLSEARLERLMQTTEGSPLLAEALLVDDAWRSDRAVRRSALLERSARARLELLSEPARCWLEALAVLGADSDHAWITSLSRLETEEAREAAEEAGVAGLARVEHGRWSPDSRTVGELVLARLSAERARSLYRAAAEHLSRLGEDQGEAWRLARLWSAAGEAEAASEAAAAAAEAAARQGLPDEAARRYAFALRHCSRPPERRFELRTRQADALIDAGLYRAAARALGGALRLSRTAAERTDLLGRQAHALVLAGRFARARASAEAAMALAKQEGLAVQHGRALIAIGVVLGRLGNEDEALAHFEQAHRLLRREDDRLLEAEALQNLAVCKARLERDDAEADFLRAIELYRQLGRPGSELKSLVGLASIRLRDGRLEPSAELLEEVRHRAREQGQLDLHETALSKLAQVATEQGRLDRALALGREALDQALHLGDPNRMTVDRCRVAEALIGLGRPGEAVELLRATLTGALDRVEPDMVDSSRMLLAHALSETPGAPDEEVASLLEKCMDGFRGRRKTRPLLMALVMEMERRCRPGQAAPFEPVHLEFEALAAGAESEVPAEVRVRAELARGRYLLERGNASAARDEARSATKIAEGAGRLDLGAQAHGLLGRVLVQLDDEDGAAEVLERGARMLEEAGRRIEESKARETFAERPVFRELRAHAQSVTRGNERRLLALYDMIRAMNSETDPDALLETILDMALRAVSAERGMILLRDPGDDDRFSVHVSRNLERETRDDAESFSRRIVARAGEGRSILALNAREDARFKDVKSVSLYGIQSLMCVPLRSRGTIVGTVYLDSRQQGALLTPEDLRFLEAFSDHAALALENVRERAALVNENRRLRTVAETRTKFANIVARSQVMQEVFELIEKVANTDLPVLVQGESGTGKELVARAIHFHGPRKRRVFLSENCAAIPETLLESELFGHVRGAFTGAERDRLGLFEQADGGTLFLDEVGDMSPAMQARLLRAIQEGEIRRVGGDGSIKVDVRLVAATHHDLAAEVAAGRFREDLLYRLQVVPIHIPPLRERREDISPLIDDLLERIARERGRETPSLDPRVRSVLERHDWPGNVRELENCLQRLVLMAGDGAIDLGTVHSDESLGQLLGDERPAAPVETYTFRTAAREQLRKALGAAGGNREKAARLMGVSRATIYRKIKDLGL